jgi:restriction endonuclease S subunit
MTLCLDEMLTQRWGPLPEKWAWTKVSELGRPGEQTVLTGPFGTSLGRSDFTDSGVPVLTIGCLNGGAPTLDKALYVSSEKAQELGRYKLVAGDLLFSRMASVGRAGLVPATLTGALFNYHIMRLRLDSDLVHPGYFLAYVQGSAIVRQYLADINHGATRDGINSEQLLDMPVALPARDEQNRIVAEFEKQAARLDDAVCMLEGLVIKLRRYKGVTFATAHRGRAGSAEYPDAQAYPATWDWVTLEHLAAAEKNAITDGPFGSNLKTEHYTERGPRVVRLQNIGDGEFINARAHISAERFESLAKHRVLSGDVVIAALGEELPRACVVPEHLGDAIVKADCIRFKPDPAKALAQYISIVLNAQPTRRQVRQIVHGVGRPRMNLSEIKAIRVPVPPIPEQRRIIADVERRVSVIKQVEAAVKGAQNRAERLRQAILKKAFAGRLVPQDPTDEPASALLDRIRKERQQPAPAPKRRPCKSGGAS